MNMRLFVYPYYRILGSLVMAILLSIASRSAFADITAEELTRFVQGYLNAAQQPTPEAEVDHYANRVRYFDSGTVDQDFVAADQRRYYKLWPERSFELLEEPMIIEHDGDAATVSFIIRYDVSGAGRRATGMTENTMRVRRFDDGLKIVAMSERKVKPKTLPRQSERPRLEAPVERTKPSPGPTPPPPADLPPATETPARKPESRDMPALRERQTPEPNVPVEKTEASRGDLSGAPVQANAAPEKATPVPEAPGFVYPPGTEHTPKNMLDVRGYTTGQKVKDPRTGKIFIVP